VKASDIADATVLRLLATPRVCATDHVYDGLGWWSRWDVCARFPGYPERVVIAKLRRLMTRGLVAGCLCGCRGDFELTAAGRDSLDI
jgi:hypothetical protein